MISIIICTCNRPKKVCDLVSLLLDQNMLSDEIIVVDSSDDGNLALLKNEQVKYIRSSHKNQPYQRYLGYHIAKNDWLLYLDDDMEPVNDKAITGVRSLISEVPEAVAFAIRFENLHEDTSLGKMPKSIIKRGKGSLSRLLLWFTGYPLLKDGKVGWNGLRGKQPKGGFTEWFSGGAFLVKKDSIFKNFNFSLFTMFEKKLGMGEDFIISYTVSRQGKIWATTEVFFYHNDQNDSSYTADIKSFNLRVIYSRLYLSLEKARVTNTSPIIAIIIYCYYSIWRFLGLLVNLAMKPSKSRFYSIRGFFSGFLMSFELINISPKTEHANWTKNALKDL